MGIFFVYNIFVVPRVNLFSSECGSVSKVIARLELESYREL